jgi:hypothetical protein
MGLRTARETEYRLPCSSWVVPLLLRRSSTSPLRFALYMVIAALILLAGGIRSSAQTRLQIVASGIGVQDQAGNVSAGHAFMIISVLTRTGIKEEAFGFYEDRIVNHKPGKAKSTEPAKDPLEPTENEMTNGKDPGLTRMIVGYPGALNSEFRRNPDRLSHSTVSFDMPLDADQRRAIYATVTKWNEHNYALLGTNCIDFVNSIAKAVGLPNVLRAPAQTPESYVSQLKLAYEQKLDLERIAENSRRDKELKQIEDNKKRVTQQQAQARAQVQAPPQIPGCLSGVWRLRSNVRSREPESAKITVSGDTLTVIHYNSHQSVTGVFHRFGNDWKGTLFVPTTLTPVGCNRINTNFSSSTWYER